MFKLTIELPDEAFVPFKELMLANMHSLNAQMSALRTEMNRDATQLEAKQNIEDYAKLIGIQAQIVHDIIAALPEKDINQTPLIHVSATGNADGKLIIPNGRV